MKDLVCPECQSAGVESVLMQVQGTDMFLCTACKQHWTRGELNQLIKQHPED